MADSLVFAESVDSESSEPIMMDRQWLYVNDQNNSSYGSQIILDSTAISNSGAYLGWNEGLIICPLVLQIEGPSTAFIATNSVDYALALKSGYFQLLHSLSVELNNGSVVQTSNFLNVFTSFKCLTSWSDNDLKNWGAVTGFFPDTSTSWVYNSIASSATNGLSPNGLGICNNRTAFTTTMFSNAILAGATYVQNTVLPTSFPVLNTPATISANSKNQCVNLGLLQRQRWLAFSPTLAVSGTLSDSSNKMLLLGQNTVNLNAIFQSYIQATGPSGAETGRAIVFNAVIRLKDICDFFGKMCLLKGATIRLYLNTNQTYFTVNAYAGTISTAGVVVPASLSLASTPVILGGGGTNPIMVSSLDVGQGLFPAVMSIGTTPTEKQALTQFKVGLSIVRTQFSQFTSQVSAPMQAVRLYVPAYTLTPQAEARYLAMSPTKKIVYNDFFQFTIPSVSGSFNVLVSNGLPSLRSVLCVPTIDKISNGSDAGAGNYVGVTTSSLLSPFSSTGGSPDPIPITQFNIQLSGKNVYNANIDYDYRAFVEQLVSSNQLNGGMTTGLSSGLIGYNDFEQLYRYIYTNCSRGAVQDVGVAKSVQIQGNTQSQATVSILVFCEFERSVVINVASGQVVV